MYALSYIKIWNEEAQSTEDASTPFHPSIPTFWFPNLAPMVVLCYAWPSLVCSLTWSPWQVFPSWLPQLLIRHLFTSPRLHLTLSWFFVTNGCPGELPLYIQQQIQIQQTTIFRPLTDNLHPDSSVRTKHSMVYYWNFNQLYTAITLYWKWFIT